MRARKRGETERSFRKKEHPPCSPTKVAATQAKVYMTNICLCRLQGRLLLFPGIHATTFSEHDLSFFLLL